MGEHPGVGQQKLLVQGGLLKSLNLVEEGLLNYLVGGQPGGGQKKLHNVWFKSFKKGSLNN